MWTQTQRKQVVLPLGWMADSIPTTTATILYYHCRIKSWWRDRERSSGLGMIGPHRRKKRQTMTTMSLARIAKALQRDFSSTANQLRQEGKVVGGKPQSCVDAANTLDRLAATVKDVVQICCSPTTNSLRKILIVSDTANCFGRSRSREKSKTASEYLSAYISDRTGGGRVT
jgi:hypothetical protein